MTVASSFKKGVDIPPWVWLTQAPSILGTAAGGGLKYDGIRYIWGVGSAFLYRYDTWTNGWMMVSSTFSNGNGGDIVYDRTRNLVIILNGNNDAGWRVYNPNTVAVTFAGQSCAAGVGTTLSPTLPFFANIASAIVMPIDADIVSPVLPTLSATTSGQTTTNVSVTTNSFYSLLVGLQVRVTSGAQSGSVRQISAVVDSNNITLVSGLSGALSSGDTFVIECVTGTASSGTTTTLTDTAKIFITNKYSNWDVEIIGGTGVGQRRRIASNTATVITLASTVTGNPRTGVFSVSPDATSMYRIIPSTDFIYAQRGNNNADLYKLDVMATSPTWTALTSIPVTVYSGASLNQSSAVAPGHIIMVRGSSYSTIYQYDIGLNTWTQMTTVGLAGNSSGQLGFSQGTMSVPLSQLGKLAILKDGSANVLAYDLATGVFDVFGTHPYTFASSGTEGRRLEEVRTPDGIRWLYLMRSGGPEFWRVPIEWM